MDTEEGSQINTGDLDLPRLFSRGISLVTVKTNPTTDKTITSRKDRLWVSVGNLFPFSFTCIYVTDYHSQKRHIVY